MFLNIYFFVFLVGLVLLSLFSNSLEIVDCSALELVAPRGTFL